MRILSLESSSSIIENFLSSVLASLSFNKIGKSEKISLRYGSDSYAMFVYKNVSRN